MLQLVINIVIDQKMTLKFITKKPLLSKLFTHKKSIPDPRRVPPEHIGGGTALFTCYSVNWEFFFIIRLRLWTYNNIREKCQGKQQTRKEQCYVQSKSM